MLDYHSSCGLVAVETIQTIIVFSPAIPIVVAIIYGLISFISRIPKYFEDLKHSRDEKTLQIMRQEVYEEIYKERNKNFSEICHLRNQLDFLHEIRWPSR